MLTRVKRLLTLPGKTNCEESEAACQCLWQWYWQKVMNPLVRQKGCLLQKYHTGMSAKKQVKSSALKRRKAPLADSRRWGRICHGRRTRGFSFFSSWTWEGRILTNAALIKWVGLSHLRRIFWSFPISSLKILSMDSLLFASDWIFWKFYTFLRQTQAGRSLLITLREGKGKSNLTII